MMKVIRPLCTFSLLAFMVLASSRGYSGWTQATLLVLASSTGPLAAQGTPDPWWDAVIYEIYPRSFQDSTDDGINIMTLMTDDASLQSTKSLTHITLPPFVSWVASVQ